LLSLSLTASGATLAFSTYLGGLGDEQPYAVAADHNGNTIVVGATGSPDFLGLPPAKGTADAFIVKLDPSGAIVFKMLLGGGGVDVATAVAVDASGNLYVTGYTDSTDFPRKNAFRTQSSAFGDAFLVKLTGGGDLIYSTLLGGSGSDQGLSVAVDDSGRACVVLRTSSHDLPLVNAAQGYSTASLITYLATFNADGAALHYSTYLGGSAGDAYVRMDGAGNAYVAGSASSVNFQTTAGAYQTQLRGPSDGFLTKLDPNGAVVFSTFLGGTNRDVIAGLDVRNGAVYVTGYTSSSDFPTRNPLMAVTPGSNGSNSVFAAKFTAGGELVYSTYLGDGANPDASLITVNSRDEAFVLFPVLKGVLPSKDAIQPTLRVAPDLYLLQLDANGSTLKFATYFGGSDEEVAGGLTVDSSDRAVIAGRTSSTDLPLAHAAQAQYAGGTSEAFVAAFQVTPLPPPRRRSAQH
jgi:hypothetical protein